MNLDRDPMPAARHQPALPAEGLSASLQAEQSTIAAHHLHTAFADIAIGSRSCN
jgi:hypothetical protein